MILRLTYKMYLCLFPLCQFIRSNANLFSASLDKSPVLLSLLGFYDALSRAALQCILCPATVNCKLKTPQGAQA